jgi:hypothetical protein
MKGSARLKKLQAGLTIESPRSKLGGIFDRKERVFF